MRRVLPLVLLAFTLSLASCQKDEEVLPAEELSSVDQSIDYMSPSKPRAPKSVDQSIDYMSPSKPRAPKSVDQSIDYMSPSKPRAPK